MLLLPAAPFLPNIATAPARHHQDAHLIGEIEELVSLYLAFQPDHVEMKIAYVVELIAQTFRALPHEHVRRPPAPADEYHAPVDPEQSPALRRQLGGDFPNAKASSHGIRGLAGNHEAQHETVQILRSQRIGPPQFRIFYLQLRKIFWVEADVLGLAGAQLHRHGKMQCPDLALQ